jgi:hypothetical protein
MKRLSLGCLLAPGVTLVCAVAAHTPAAGQDPQEAHGFACENGELLSCNLLGLMLETGAGGVRDLERALSLYGRVCDAGVMEGCARFELAREAFRGGTDASPPTDYHRSGRVADAETGAPIAGAIVTLPDVGFRTMSDSVGRVDLGRLTRGRHRMRTERGGYQPLAAELPVPWDTEFLILLEETAAIDDPDLGQVYGRVTIEGAEEGLANVEISIDGEAGAGTLSDRDGRFNLGDLDPGTIELGFSSLGFATRSVTVTVEAGRTVEIYLSMAARPIALAPIEVVVSSPYLQRSGFYRRARSSWGTRFTRRDLERIDPLVLSELVVRAPGVAVSRRLEGARIVSRRRAAATSDEACYLLPYVDGLPLLDWDVDLVIPSDVEGVEIYQGPTTPVEYLRPVDPRGTQPCGVVLIWTRRPG